MKKISYKKFKEILCNHNYDFNKVFDYICDENGVMSYKVSLICKNCGKEKIKYEQF